MYFLLSGEGATDMGTGTHSNRLCEGNYYEPGPMAMIVEQLVKDKTKQSFIADQRCCFIRKKTLLAKAKFAKSGKKGMRLPGNKNETRYFYNVARALGVWAKEKQAKHKEPVVAVLFRDSDGPSSAGRGTWQLKWNSMLDGFNDAGFNRGVPMLPQPISEAWLLCALKKNNPYQNCASLENRSSSPRAKKPLKSELSKRCDGKVSRSDLCVLIESGRIDILRIDMPSFNAFKSRLLEAI